MTLDLLARRTHEVADTGGKPSRETHFPCFDGLRAIAALTVIGVHTAFVCGLTTKHPGWGRYTSRLEIGVEVFFVISGFLLYRPFVVAHFGARSVPSTGSFWMRRLKRIIPAYWLAFIVITYVLRADSGGPTWKGPLIYLGFAQIYFPAYIKFGLSQAWSLCTEMSFYIMIPLYAAALGRRGRPPGKQLKAEMAGLAGLVLIGLVYRLLILGAAYRDSMAHHEKALPPAMTSWLPGYIDQFALGMLLAVASVYFHQADRRPAWLWHRYTPWVSWAAAAVAFWAVSNIGLPLKPLIASPTGLSLERQTLYGLFAFFLVLPAVFGPQHRGPVRVLLRWRPLALIGVVSYGVYLWHEGWLHMYLVWTGDRLFDIPWSHLAVGVTVLAVAAATLSYKLIERPVIRSGRGRGAGFGLRPHGRPVPTGDSTRLSGVRT
jgi:peptidoglycan/LPS O-acetylase OafA/YrhL